MSAPLAENETVVSVARDGLHIKRGHKKSGGFGNPLKKTGIIFTAAVLIIILVVVLTITLIITVITGLCLSSVTNDDKKKWSTVGKLFLVDIILFLFLVLALATVFVPGLSVAMSIVGIVIFVLGLFWVFWWDNCDFKPKPPCPAPCSDFDTKSEECGDHCRK